MSLFFYEAMRYFKALQIIFFKGGRMRFSLLFISFLLSYSCFATTGTNYQDCVKKEVRKVLALTQNQIGTVEDVESIQSYSFTFSGYVYRLNVKTSEGTFNVRALIEGYAGKEFDLKSGTNKDSYNCWLVAPTFLDKEHISLQVRDHRDSIVYDSRGDLEVQRISNHRLQ